MAKVFISYSRHSDNVATILSRDIAELGHTVLWDQELCGGHVWWERILSTIRDCTVFVFVLDEEALKSVACMSELGYARALAKPLLPVLVSDSSLGNLLPTSLAEIQFIDYRSQDRAAAFRLARAFSEVPAPQPLPTPLPQPPEAPISPIVRLGEQVRTESSLTDVQQRVLLADLRQLFYDPPNAREARALLEDFRKRRDILATIAEEVDVLLVSRSPFRSRRLKWREILTRKTTSLAAVTAFLMVVVVLFVGIGQQVTDSPVATDESVVYSRYADIPEGNGILSLTAVLSSGGPAAPDSDWTVYEARVDALGNRKVIASGLSTEQRFTLPAGMYKLTVKNGSAVASRNIGVRRGMVADDKVVLNAGIVDLTALFTSSGPAVDNASWGVYEADALGSGRLVASGLSTEQRFTLPAGKYKVAVEKDNATATQSLEVGAGELKALQIVLNAGIVDLTALFASHGPTVDNPHWEVFEARADAVGNRKHIASGISTEQRFTLPAGEYKIKVEKGNATATQDLVIRAGQVKSMQIVLNAGVVDVMAVFASSGGTAENPNWAVSEKPDTLGNRKRVADGYSTNQRFILSGGRYTLEVEKSGAATTQDIEIQPGKRIELKLVLKK